MPDFPWIGPLTLDVPVGAKNKILQVTLIDFSMYKLLTPLMLTLRESGYEVHGACADGPYAMALRELGFGIHSIPFVRRAVSVNHPVALAQLIRLMRRERYAAVHVHTTLGASLGRLAAKLAGVPVVFYTAHGFRFHEHRHWAMNRVLIGLERLMGSRFTTQLLTVSGEDRDAAIKEGIMSPDRIVRLNSVGVDPTLFRPARPDPILRGSLGLHQRDRVLGFVGRLVREKGIMELVQALRLIVDKVPSARLLVVGDTMASDRDRHAHKLVIERISQLRLQDHVVFAGFRDDVPEVMTLMDVFVLPSWREGMPLTVVEAMACGLPVVATNIRGCREEVIDGVTGYLVPVRDPFRLARAVTRLLDDPGLARRMGMAGRQRVLAEFTQDRVIERQLEVYRTFVPPMPAGVTESPSP